MHTKLLMARAVPQTPLEYLSQPPVAFGDLVYAFSTCRCAPILSHFSALPAPVEINTCISSNLLLGLQVTVISN